MTYVLSRFRIITSLALAFGSASMIIGQNIHFQNSPIIVHDATDTQPIWGAIATNDDQPPAVVFLKDYGPGILAALDSLAGYGPIEPISVSANEFSYLCGTNSLILRAADLDGDGDEDVIGYCNTYCSIGHDCLLFEYRRDGQSWTYLCLGQYMVPWIDPYWQIGTIALFDVDDDGDQDILFNGFVEEAVGGFLQQTHDIALFQQPDHSFVEYVPQLPVDDYFESHDLDQDGRPDLFLREGDSTFVLHNEGAGDFIPIDTLYLGSIYWFSWADATGDGIEDLVHNSYASQQWSLEAYPAVGGFLGDPFVVLSYPLSADESVSFAGSADLDNDGDQDLIVRTSHVGQSYDSTTYAYFEAFGLGNFSQTPVPFQNGGLHLLDIQDVDGDGDVDLMLWNKKSIAWLQNETIVAVDEIDVQPLKVFPVPSTDGVSIRIPSHITGTVDVHVIDAIGRTVYSASSSSRMLELDVQDWPSGTYQVMVEDRIDHQRMTARLVRLYDPH